MEFSKNARDQLDRSTLAEIPQGRQDNEEQDRNGRGMSAVGLAGGGQAGRASGSSRCERGKCQASGRSLRTSGRDPLFRSIPKLYGRRRVRFATRKIKAAIADVSY